MGFKNMKIAFDKIHTQKKQKLLKKMMNEINDEVANIENLNQKLTICPICQSSKVEDYVKAYKFNMSICKNCNLIFCNPYPNNTQLNRYYNSQMKAFENEFFRESFDSRVALFKPRVELIKKYKSNGTLLDICSAVGIFIEALSKNDTSFDITCCDMSSEACLELKTKYQNYTIINDDFLNIVTTEKYDIISMWDTIEHIVDQNLLLKKIYELLDDNGIFIFSTPNTKSFEWEIAKEKHIQILPPGHVNLMNEHNLGILLNNNNMEIVDSYTLNGSLDIGYVKKLIKNEEINDLDIGSYFKEKLFDNSFEKILEQYLIDTKQAGNIVIIAKKRQ
jgi:2-polyprenyl-3-methyl-5-hydroxy-6-metoxy-1,4-benzoquinol methylase